MHVFYNDILENKHMLQIQKKDLSIEKKRKKITFIDTDTTYTNTTYKYSKHPAATFILFKQQYQCIFFFNSITEKTMQHFSKTIRQTAIHVL